MKKIKLLTPILGLTAVTGAIAPIITSCSNAGHVWLTSIDQQEKSGNASGITYYFGLNSELYETKDIDVQVVSDNKDEFDTEWSVSGSVLSVVVKYIGEIQTGATKKTTFKLRIKTVYWSQDIELKGNFKFVVTLDEFMEKYAVWYSTASKAIAEGIAKGEPLNVCDLSKDDYYIDLDGGKEYVVEDPKDYTCYYGWTEYKYPDETWITISFFPYYKDQPIPQQWLGATFYEPENEKKEIIEDITEYGSTYEFFINEDGTIGWYRHSVDEDGLTYESEYSFNPDGTLGHFYYYGEEWQTFSFDFSNYRYEPE